MTVTESSAMHYVFFINLVAG